MTSNGPLPVTNIQIGILEFNVREAWQVGRNDLDMMGISEDDDIVIPQGQDVVPVLDLLSWRKGRSQKEN